MSSVVREPAEGGRILVAGGEVHEIVMIAIRRAHIPLRDEICYFGAEGLYRHQENYLLNFWCVSFNERNVFLCEAYPLRSPVEEEQGVTPGRRPEVGHSGPGMPEDVSAAIGICGIQQKADTICPSIPASITPIKHAPEMDELTDMVGKSSQESHFQLASP